MSNFIKKIRGFHSDERGLEALQVVMIIAIAAVCLIVIKNYWAQIKDWFEEMLTGATNKNDWDTKKGK